MNCEPNAQSDPIRAFSGWRNLASFTSTGATKPCPDRTTGPKEATLDNFGILGSKWFYRTKTSLTFHFISRSFLRIFQAFHFRAHVPLRGGKTLQAGGSGAGDDALPEAGKIMENHVPTSQRFGAMLEFELAMDQYLSIPMKISFLGG